jgi:hypothetical protein
MYALLAIIFLTTRIIIIALVAAQKWTAKGARNDTRRSKGDA